MNPWLRHGGHQLTSGKHRPRQQSPRTGASFFPCQKWAYKRKKRNTEDKSCRSSFTTFSQTPRATGRVWSQRQPATHPVTSGHAHLAGCWPVPKSTLVMFERRNLSIQQLMDSCRKLTNNKEERFSSYLTQALKETLMTLCILPWAGQPLRQRKKGLFLPVRLVTFLEEHVRHPAYLTFNM